MGGERLYYLGVDPGSSSGAFAVIRDTTVIAVAPFDEGAFLDIVAWLGKEQEKTKCCLEKVSAMPKQGVSSTFTFGVNYGWLRGVLDLGEISYQEIRPQQWKKEFGLNSDKARSVEVCRRLFPNVDLLRTPKCKKPHDGMAEALLMAEYARRKL